MAGESRRCSYRWRAAFIAGGAVIAAAVVALAARPGQDAGPAEDADTRELQAYRLSMPRVRQMNEAYLAYFKALQSDPQFVALQRAREELRALEHKEELTEADERRIAQLEAQVEKAEDLEGLNAGEQQSLSDMAKAVERQAPLAAAIRKAGLTPREFAKIQLSLLQAMFVHGFMKSGSTKELPKEVPEENVAFVREHEAELTAMARQWQGIAGERDEADMEPADDEESQNEEEAP